MLLSWDDDMADLKDIMKRRSTLVAKVGDLGALRNGALGRFEAEPSDGNAQAYRDALVAFQRREGVSQQATAEMVRALEESMKVEG